MSLPSPVRVSGSSTSTPLLPPYPGRSSSSSPSSSSPRHLPIKPAQLTVCCSQKRDDAVTTIDASISRRLALTVLIVAAVGTKISPADAAYVEAANVFGKPNTNTDFSTYVGNGFKLSIPSKWNPSNEVKFPGQVFRYEDNFDTTSNLAVIVTPTDKENLNRLWFP